MQSNERSQLKTGKRPRKLQMKTLKEGEVLFEEGSFGKEVYIIQDGKVGVYKNTPEGQTELATIEMGGIIGEMSLLDNQPRSATIRAVEKTNAIIVNEKVFQESLKKAPVWLTSIIKIIISRLRDANIRIDISALRDHERGLASLILLLLPEYKYEFSSKIAINYDMVIVEAYYVCKLKKKEILKLLSSFEKREIIEIIEDDKNKKHICISDLEVLKLFFEYLTLKSQHKEFQETSIPHETVNLLSNIAYVAQKSGVETKDGTTLSKTAFLADMSDKDVGNLDNLLLDLRRRNLINIMPEGDDTIIIFKPSALSRIKKIKDWLPKFEMNV